MGHLFFFHCTKFVIKYVQQIFITRFLSKQQGIKRDLACLITMRKLTKWYFTLIYDKSVHNSILIIKSIELLFSLLFVRHYRLTSENKGAIIYNNMDTHISI